MGQRGDDPTTTADRGAAAPTRVRYLVLTAVCSLAVLTYFQRQGFAAGTPYIKKDLGLGDSEIGYLAAAWLISYGVFQVPGGLFGDRLGARRLLTVLVLGWSLVTAAVGLAAFSGRGWQAFAFLLVLRILFGAFQAGGFPGIARVVADWMPGRQRGFAQGMIWTCTRLGGFLAPLIVVWLITEVFGNWATPCWLLGGLGLGWCAVFWWWFRDRPEQTPEVNAAELAFIASDRDPAPPPRGPIPWARLLRSRNVWALCLTYGFVGFSGNFITNLLNVYLRDHRRLDDRTTAWLAGLPLAFGVVSCLLGGVASDWLVRRLGSRKWGRRLVGCVVMALAALAALSPIFVREVWLLGLAFSAWLFFNDGIMAPAWAACADIGERHAGTLSGAMNMAGAFLGAAGTAVAGRLFDRGLDDRAFVLFACSYALAGLCWMGVDVTQPLVPAAEET